MKIKEGFILRNVANNWIVISVGALNFDGLIKLNDSGVFLWKLLEKGSSMDEIIRAFLEEYEVSEEIARRDVALFLNKLKDANLLDE